MPNDNIKLLVLSTAALFMGITGFVIYFVILYRNKQLVNKQEQERLQAEFDQELLKTQIEIQEETLNNISCEIHDNINQVLSFVKLNLGMIAAADVTITQKINDNRELIAQTITDLRNLSKSLSFEHIAALGLVKTLELDVKRLNDSGLINAGLDVKGDRYSLGEQHELVLFRIFQEALNNTLKYSGANQIQISLQYYPELFILTINDNGVGFTPQLLNNQSGAGLRNMQNRAILIGAVMNIISEPDEGCDITVTLNPFKLRLHSDGLHQDRIS